VIGTYAAVLAVLAASLTIGQAALALCGVKRWSWLSPALGLALLGAICWGTVRLPGHGIVSAVVVLILAVAATLFLRGRVEGAGEALWVGLPVALLALAAASLPFVIEGRFGILGTGFNPDMSQHLLAAHRLAHGAGSQLLHQGYPLGPHAIVVALDKGLGIGLVQGFGGLSVAVAVLAPLTALAALADQPPLRRTAAALLVGLPYMVASYFAQGAFKETIEALFVLAFALSLRESSRSWRHLPLRFVPAAVMAIGAVYAYSFPGLSWLVATAALWGLGEWAWSKRAPSAGGAAAAGPARLRALSLALIVFAVGALPELGRMIHFHGFETFAPHGRGLGNLFGQISPFEALGIWPSGDFRLAPGDGAAPAAAFWLGAGFAAALLLYGLARCLRRRETALAAGLFAAAAVYAATRVGGTPYTAAKAVEVAAPLATLAILLPLPREAAGWQVCLRHSGKRARAALGTAAAAIYLLAAGGCSLLALANAPVGPTSYSPALTELRPLLASGSTLVLAPPRLLEEHGTPYIAWELRGGRVCIEDEDAAGGAPPAGVRFVITEGSPGRVSGSSPEGVLKIPPQGSPGRASEGVREAGAKRRDGSAEQPPFRDLRVRRVAPPYVLWERAGPVRGRSPCPLIAVRQARQGTER
jgi:hypothetical protein